MFSKCLLKSCSKDFDLVYGLLSAIIFAGGRLFFRGFRQCDEQFNQSVVGRLALAAQFITALPRLLLLVLAVVVFVLKVEAC